MFWFLLLTSLAVAIYIFIFYSKFFQIEKISVIRHNLGLNRGLIEEQLSDLYGENIFLINPTKIQNDLAKEFPALAYANINRVYPRTLEIEVNSFKDAVIVRDDFGETYSVNEIGMVSATSVQNFDLPLMVVHNHEKVEEYNEALEAAETEEGEDIISEDAEEGVVRREFTILDPNEEQPEEAPNTLYEVGEFIFSQEELDKLTDVKKIFEEEMDLVVDTMEYYVVEREYHFIIAATYPYAIKFDLQKPIEEQIAKLKQAENLIDLRNDPLEYIDLRISGNKIFYMPLDTE